MGKDRFLWVILAAIALLAVLAVALFFLRRGTQEYTSDDTPQGVVRNYVLAVEKKDFRRAYGYLGEGAGKPSYERFCQDFISRSLDTSNAALQIGDAQYFEKEAFVALVVIRGGGGPFGDVYREQASALLVRDDSGAWRISSMPYPYWGWDCTTPSC